MSIYEDFYGIWYNLKESNKTIEGYEKQLDDWHSRYNELYLKHLEKVEALEKCKQDLRDLRSDLAEKWQEIRDLKTTNNMYHNNNVQLRAQLVQKDLQVAELLKINDPPEPDVTFDPQPE